MLMERRGIDTKFEKLETNSSNNGEEMFRSTLVACRKRAIVKYLLLTRTSVTREVIRQARKLGMISPTYSWLILNPVSKKKANCKLKRNWSGFTSLNNNKEQGGIAEIL